MSEYEERVINKIRERAEMGLKKYGVGVDRTDLTLLQWCQHLQEEQMDSAIYLERIMQEIKSKDL